MRARQKADSNPRQMRFLSLTLYCCTTDNIKYCASFLILKCPKQTLVGGASVNSVCQQGMLFAICVNRHSVFDWLKWMENILCFFVGARAHNPDYLKSRGQCIRIAQHKCLPFCALYVSFIRYYGFSLSVWQFNTKMEQLCEEKCYFWLLL